MDRRIADYIAANRHRYTREAIRQQLIDAGHDPADIDATWAALDAPDADDVAGEGFWKRFFLILVGVNVGVLLLVGLATGMIGTAGATGLGLLGVLAVVMAIGALIAWGIVAATRPAQMGRTTAMVVGTAIPLLIALLLGGACYAMVGAIGPPPPPALEGTMELHIDAPHAFDGSGSAMCQPYGDGNASIYSTNLGRLDDRNLYVNVEWFGGAGPAPEPGGAEPAPGGGGVHLNVSLEPLGENDVPQMWLNGGGSTIDAEIGQEGLSGSVAFAELVPSEQESAPRPGDALDTISGTITWSCDS